MNSHIIYFTIYSIVYSTKIIWSEISCSLYKLTELEQDFFLRNQEIFYNPLIFEYMNKV